MTRDFLTPAQEKRHDAGTKDVQSLPASLLEAEGALQELAAVFLQRSPSNSATHVSFAKETEPQAIPERSSSNAEAKYRALLEQIPAVVFMAYLDKSIGEAYVSPQIEAALGFSQREWLEDLVRWYQQVHPDDKARRSVEAAEMFLTGKPLRSAYRVMARDGRVLWFHCEAKMIRHEDGRPWFIHGVGVDVTELKQAEVALQEQRNLLSAILDTVGALVVVLDQEGRIIRFNRACEQLTGYAFEEVQGRPCGTSSLFPKRSASSNRCSGRFVVTSRGPNTRAVGSHVTEAPERLRGRRQSCPVPDKHRPTSSFRASM